MKRRTIVALLSFAVLLAGCSREPETVATLAVTPSELALPFPGFETVEIALTPSVELPPGTQPQLFLHLVDEPGSVLRTFDMPLPGSWLVGRTNTFTARIYQSALADPLESGSYLLTAGLYDPVGERFALATDARPVAKLEYAVATVTVPPAGSSLPTVRFSGSWLPVAPGQDRQILARRGIDGAGPATFQIGPLEPPGQLLLRLSPPPPGKLELSAGAAAAKVRLRSSCGGYESELAGEAAVETLIDVPEAASAVSCDVELSPSFVVRAGGDGRASSVTIEVLAWRPGRPDA